LCRRRDDAARLSVSLNVELCLPDRRGIIRSMATSILRKRTIRLRVLAAAVLAACAVATVAAVPRARPLHEVARHETSLPTSYYGAGYPSKATRLWTFPGQDKDALRMASYLTLPDGTCFLWPEHIALEPGHTSSLVPAPRCSPGLGFANAIWQPASAVGYGKPGWITLLGLADGWHLIRYVPAATPTVADDLLLKREESYPARPSIIGEARGATLSSMLTGIGVTNSHTALFERMLDYFEDQQSVSRSTIDLYFASVAKSGGPPEPKSIHLPVTCKVRQVALSQDGARLA